MAAFFQIKKQRLPIGGRIEFLEIVLGRAPAARVREETGADILPIDFHDAADAVDNGATRLELKEIRAILRDSDVPCEAMTVLVPKLKRRAV